MALVEIDDGELANYKQVTGVMQQMLNNPKTRRKILEAQKELNPNTVIPELDAAAPVMDELKSFREALAADKAEREAEKAEREKEKRMNALQGQWDKGRSMLRANGYTDEGLSEVEKFMEEKGLVDHEIAAAAFEKLHPPTEPVRAVGGNRFDIFDAGSRTNEHTKALFENPDNDMALNALVTDTLRSVRGR